MKGLDFEYQESESLVDIYERATAPSCGRRKANKQAGTYRLRATLFRPFLSFIAGDPNPRRPTYVPYSLFSSSLSPSILLLRYYRRRSIGVLYSLVVGGSILKRPAKALAVHIQGWQTLPSAPVRIQSTLNGETSERRVAPPTTDPFFPSDHIRI